MKNIAVGFVLSLLMVGQANSQTSNKCKHKKYERSRRKRTLYVHLSDKVTRQKVTFKNRYRNYVIWRFVHSKRK